MLKSSYGLLYAEDLSHRIRRFFLCYCSDMGISVQCEPSGEVAEHTGYGFYVNSILQRNRSEGREI